MVLTVVYSVVLGLLIGSFLTVVVDRVPDGRSVISPGSACGACGLELGPRDLVPVVSWLLLRGRCRQCRVSIGIEPVVLELVTAALFGLLASKLGLRWALPGFFIYAAGLVGLSAIDVRTKRLPRKIIYVTAALGVPFLVIDSLVRGDERRLVMMFAGASIALLFMGLVYLASRGGMGDGDVRLAPLLGAYLGWQGLVLVPVGLFAGFMLGAVIGVAMMGLGKAGRKTALPFGPFLAAGALAAIFIGEPIARVLGWIS
jgi:leader peptidase (prepilin peptidase) / N-methyltransferase